MPTASSAVRDAEVIEEFRANGGRVGGALAGTPILLLHHVGARTGRERVTPLVFTPHDDGYVITASSAGSPAHPGWYHNLRANPRAEIEVGSERFAVIAKEVEGAARDALWPGLLAASPSLREYDAATARRIPVFALVRHRWYPNHAILINRPAAVIPTGRIKGEIDG
jgi:deazaflavin-dependent oxidoreductase (nitroreductase family)